MLPPEEWMVGFDVLLDADGRPTLEGWLSLEFIVWVVNNNLVRSGRDVHVDPHATPPYLNYPGKVLTFGIDGRRDGDVGIEPDEVADALVDLAERYYMGVDDLAAYEEAEADEQESLQGEGAVDDGSGTSGERGPDAAGEPPTRPREPRR